jgi:cytochrome c556
VALAESGNLLMMVPRAKDGDEWMKRSRELIDQAERAIKAADAKNADELFTVGGDIYEACSNCHQKYLETIVNANK